MLAKKISVAIAIILSAISCTPQNSIEELQRGWENPPLSARNRVWWHWMNGNITKDGIQKDLQWMKDTRQGGVHNFDAALGTPTIVDKRLIYMDEGWKDAFAYADAKYIVDSLIKDSSVTDIYLCRQIQRINAYQERKCNLSSLYGMVVSK